VSEVPIVEPEAHPKGKYAWQNLLVLFLQVCAWWTILTALHRYESWAVRLPLLLLFCAMMQGVFSLMHECFHRNAHPDKRINDLVCWVGATLFATSPTLHRVQHWGHHVRNRTEAERGDFIHSGETAGKKITLYYVAVLGGLWISGFVFPLLVPFLPYCVVSYLARTKRFNTYAGIFANLKPQDWQRVRIEAVASAACWALAVWLSGWSWLLLAIAYGCFAFTWSSLQWVYHLGAPIDVVEGAYNLRLPTPLRWFFLNFNYNLTHHREPHRPWQELFAASNQKETQPLWYRWALVFKPPVPYPEDLSDLAKRYF